MSKKNFFLFLIVFSLFVFASAGCSNREEAQKDEQNTQDKTAEVASSKQEADLDPTELLLVSKAKDDLADKLDIDVDEIEFIAFRPVVWGDGSLGCPKPGMAYKQVLVDGYSILLKVGDIYYDYHGGGSRDPFLCKAEGSYNSLTPVPPHPADQ